MTARRARLLSVFAAALLALLPAAGTPPARAATPLGQLDTIRTDSGLRYADTKVGGGRRAEKGDIAIVQYTGWLYVAGEKGQQFDTSRNSHPFSFRIGGGRVIKGWDEGLVGMRVGGERTLIIPSELAYGTRGGGDRIPPNADLVFEIELVDLR